MQKQVNICIGTSILIHPLLHLIYDADADDGEEEEDVADDEGSQVVRRSSHLSDLIHQDTNLLELS